MTEQEFNNLMSGIAEVRRYTQSLFTLRVWARIGEVDVTYLFRNVVSAEAYDLVRSVYAAIGLEIGTGTARVTMEPQPVRV